MNLIRSNQDSIFLDHWLQTDPGNTCGISVTLFLVLVNIFNTVTTNTPKVSKLMVTLKNGFYLCVAHHDS